MNSNAKRATSNVEFVEPHPDEAGTDRIRCQVVFSYARRYVKMLTKHRILAIAILPACLFATSVLSQEPKVLTVGVRRIVAADAAEDIGLESGAGNGTTNSATLNAWMADSSRHYPIYFPGGKWYFAADTSNELKNPITFDGSSIRASTSGASDTISLSGHDAVTAANGAVSDVQGILQITSNTGGWIPGYYQIVSANETNDTWTLDRECCEGAATNMEGVATFPITGCCVHTPVKSGLVFTGNGLAHGLNIHDSALVTKIIYDGPRVELSESTISIDSGTKVLEILSGYTVKLQDVNATLEISPGMNINPGFYNINAADPDNNSWYLDRVCATGDIHISITGAVYDHAENGEGDRHLSLTGAFSGYTHKPGDRIYVSSASGGVATGFYEIASKVDDDAILLVDDAGLTDDATDVDAENRITCLMTYALWKDRGHGNDYSGLNWSANDAPTTNQGADDPCHVGLHVESNRHGINTGKHRITDCTFTNFTAGVMCGRNMASAFSGNANGMDRDIGYGDNTDYPGAVDNHADNVWLQNIRAGGCDTLFYARNVQSVGHRLEFIRCINVGTMVYAERSAKLAMIDVHMGGSRTRFLRIGGFTSNHGLVEMRMLTIDGQANVCKIVQMDGTAEGIGSSNYINKEGTRGRIIIDGVHVPSGMTDWVADDFLIDVTGAVRLSIRNWDERMLKGTVLLKEHPEDSKYRPLCSIENTRISATNQEDVIHSLSSDNVRVYFFGNSSNRTNETSFMPGVWETGLEQWLWVPPDIPTTDPGVDGRLWNDSGALKLSIPTTDPVVGGRLWNDSGALKMSIPTSDPEVAGEVWNDNGVLKVSEGS